MNKGIRRSVFALAAISGSLAVGACSDDSNGSRTTQLKLAVSDAPVDGARAVVVVFDAVELRGPDDAPFLIEFDEPKAIDLLNDSGTASAVLFDEPIPSGAYTQIRLLVSADGDPNESYIELGDGSRQGLRVPSGAQTGLKLVSGFDAPPGGIANFTVDFDLRKAVTCPPGQDGVCLLRPALRLVNNDQVGNIQGIVSASLVPEGCAPGVYLYSGDVAQPRDNDSTAVNLASQPLASKVPVVTAQSEGGYYYQLTFLPPGDYTVALTCAADIDDPDRADAEVTFAPIVDGIAVTAGQTTTVDLP
ncbi:MAG TPA: DUF4382 domain-containing protein [Fontimonas sp.]